MKNWLLCFFALIIAVTAVPLGAKSAFSEVSVPKIRVFMNGEIKEMDTEEYAYLVLLGEKENATHPETKKALAVAARSIGVYISVFGCKHKGFDVCANGNCCIALGNPNNYSEEAKHLCKIAVESTKGETLVYKNLPAMALFSRCNGSGSENCKEYSYLVSVAEPQKCESHVFYKKYDYSVLTPLLLKPSSFDLVKDNSVLVYTENNKCDFAIMDGKYIKSSQLAKVLELQSKEFYITFSESWVNAQVFGEGNGYGLSLCGAEKTAKAGDDYQKILKYYYPNLLLKKMYNC